MEHQLTLNPNNLIAFIDDTGHEEFAPGHSIYGLGGCAVQVGNLDGLIRRPWREVRCAILGDPDAPLHAADITRSLPREKQALIGRFFERFAFMRFAVVATSQLELPDPLVLLDIVAPVLINRVLDLLNATAAPAMTVIFEGSERADAKIEHHFSKIKIDERGVDVPIEWGFMRKQVQEPALEVADFIMHAVHGLAHDQLQGRNGYARRDFRSIFHRKNTRLSSFMLIDNVVPSSPVQEAAPA